MGRARNHEIVAGRSKCVVVLIDVYELVPAEIDGSGKSVQVPPKKFGMIDLQRERLPSAGRAAGEQTRVRFGDDAEMRFEVGNQLLSTRRRRGRC